MLLENRCISVAALIINFERSGIVTNEGEVRDLVRIIFQRERKIPVIDVLIHNGFSSILALEGIYSKLRNANVSFGPDFFSEFEEAVEGCPFYLAIVVDKDTNPEEREVNRFMDRVRCWVENRGLRVVILCEGLDKVPAEMVTNFTSVFVAQEKSN